MADNVPITAGSGTSIATDDAGGVHFQRFKLDVGGDGVSVPIVGSDTVPDNQVQGVPVRVVGQDVWNVSFSSVGASVLAPEFGTPIVGTGVTYSQAAGALAVVAGTTANSEFLTRSIRSWRSSLRLRFSAVMSQRIAQNNFVYVLADLIGEALSCTINSAVSISITKTAHGFTSQNVGQFMLIGGIAGAAGVPGRYAIASIPDANTINFTVAGWPASGSCTLTLFGHSYIRTIFNGTTATAAGWDTQRRGWAAGDTTLAINTTASPGTVIQVEADGRACYVADTLRATTATPNVTTRASRIENLPDDNLDLYLFVWSYNGTSNPATSTTWTISFVALEKFANTPVYLQGSRAVGTQNPIPIAPTGTQTVSGTVTANIGTGSIAAGTNLIGDVAEGVRTTTTNAVSGFHRVATADTNAINVKASAGRLYGWSFYNTTSTAKFLKFHNTAGTPTAGAGVIRTVGIPPNGNAELFLGVGHFFATGIGISITGAAADADTTALAAGDVVGEVWFA
jgi:hypothetical protein